MYELIRVSEKACFIQSPAKIGVVMTEPNRVCLIDSGNDKDAGKKVKRLLEEQGWTLDAIYHTHSHADHIGGNQYLQKQTGCRIFAKGIEAACTAYPILEPSLLYGGNPPRALRHKFLLAQESDALPLTEEVLPNGWTLLPLPGHSPDMVGFRTDDGVVYLGDALASAETLEKYQISFLVDVAAYLKTLEAVKTMEGTVFVPSHAEPTDNIAPLAERNIRKVGEIAETVVERCREPIGFEALLKQLFDRYGLVITFEQYALVGSTVRSYLTWLTDTERIEPLLENNQLLWRAKA